MFFYIVMFFIFLMINFATCPDLILSSIKSYNSCNSFVNKNKLSNSCKNKKNLYSMKKFGMSNITGRLFTSEYGSSDDDLVLIMKLFEECTSF